MQTVYIFTRYPIPGQAKTRLIPQLGSFKAAELHREMSEHSVQTVRHFMAQYPDTDCHIAYTDSEKPQMAEWLGDDLHYQTQCEGDLGARMWQVVDQGFQHDQRQGLLLLGTDCPAVTPQLLAEAFDKLAEVDVVIGPALDGGYYLLALRAPNTQQDAPQNYACLFEDMPWGTDQVLSLTLDKIRQAKLSYHLLTFLSDVDRPEDVVVWREIRGRIKPEHYEK